MAIRPWSGHNRCHGEYHGSRHFLLFQVTVDEQLAEERTLCNFAVSLTHAKVPSNVLTVNDV